MKLLDMILFMILAPGPSSPCLCYRAAWMSDVEEALPHFQEHARYHREHLIAYEAELAQMEEDWGPDIMLLDTQVFGDYLTVKRGVNYEREYLSWLEWAITLLEARAKHQHERHAP